MSTRYSFAIPIIVGCAQFMHQFDGSAIATALPSMAETLHDDPLRLNLAISCYLLALAVFVPVSGWMASRYGAKRVFTIAIVVFTASSVLCGLSHTLAQLVVARTLQGIGGAMMTPVGRFIVVRTAPREALVKAINYITLPAGLAPVLGPSVGGFIVSYLSWPWIFFLNVPIGVAGVLLARRFIPDIEDERPPAFDLGGFVLAGIALAALTFGFESAGRGLLPGTVIAALLIAGAGCAVGYFFHARRAANPVIDLSLARIATYSESLTGGALFYMTTTSSVFLLSILFQIGFGLSAFHAGLMTLAVAGGTTLARFALRPILRLVRFREFLIVNAAVTGVYLVACGFFRADTPYLSLVAVLFVGGLSRALQFTAISSLSYAEIPRDLMSRATSLSAMTQQFAQSLGVGLTAFIVHFSVAAHGRDTLTAADIAPAYWAIGAASFLSIFIFARLRAQVGEDMRERGAGAPRGR